MRLVVSTFKGLLLMAGLDTPNKAQFFEALRSFCEKHGLEYASETRVAALTASILNKSDIDSDLASIKQAAERSPETMYAELMTRVATINGPAMTKYDPQLVDVAVAGDSAKGFATRNDGRKVPLPFVKTDTGWLLAEP